MSPGSLGRLLIVAGLVLIAAGALLLVAGRLPRVPGDIVVERPNLTIYVPLGTMILLSVALTLILNFVVRR
jgi:hypothetical protein